VLVPSLLVTPTPRVIPRGTAREPDKEVIGHRASVRKAGPVR
jgi:hypothetical protein